MSKAREMPEKEPKRKPVEHVVSVRLEGKKFLFAKNMECFCVRPGDTIVWKLRNKLPYFIVVKALVSPLSVHTKITGAGETIHATVCQDAVPGVYAYAIGTYDGEELLIRDPDIIVRPPDGRGH